MSTKNFVSYGDAETLFTSVGNKISGKQAKPTTISYADWLLLTPQQQETGNWLVTGVPGADLSLRVLALETNKQDKTDNNLQTTSKETTGAINELKSGLNSYETIASVTADGVKTFSELFSELYSYITEKCAIVYNGLIFNKTREVTGAVSFGTSTVMEGIVYIVNMTIYSNRTEYAEVEITSNGVTFADKGSVVVPSGRTVQLVK